MNNRNPTDIEYIDMGLFTVFVPVTKEGEIAWNELAEVTDGTGKVLTIQAQETVNALRFAGYTVRKGKKPNPLKPGEEAAMLAELGL